MIHRVCSALIAVAAIGTASAAEEIVRLTMTERCGVARKGEYVTFGVSLPKGKVRDAGALALLDGGRPVTAQFLPVTRWWEDGSLRWVHMIFRTDCPASGSKEMVLAQGTKSVSPARPVEIEESPDVITIATGAVQFRVRKQRFNIVDSASVGGKEIIRPHARGLGVNVDGKEYLASLDPTAKVIVEERSPLHAVVRAEGSFCDSEGRRAFDFVCRLYAYAGSPNVRLVVTILNRQGAIEEFLPLSACFIELPTTLKSARCLFGSEGGVKSANLAPADVAFIHQSNSDKHDFGGVLTGGGKGKSTKPTSTGWGGLVSGTTGFAAGLKWFWQLQPKAIEVNGAGLVRVDLYPQRQGAPLKIYAGVARTHEALLAFGATDPNDLASAFAGLQRPLRPFAPPKWYCRDTHALGDFCEAGGEDVYGEFADEVKAFDDAFALAAGRCREFRDRRVLKGVETDAYGFLGYGDNVHYVWTPNVNVPENIAWDGNYYGFPHMVCVQFLRTGNVEYFDTFEAHALHVADVHTVHYAGEKKQLAGGCRYCPPTDHVRIDPTNTSDYKTAKVYVSDLFNHHKVAEVIERWYFLRDHRCKEVADLVLDYCHRWTYADNDYGQPRGPGTIMTFCADAYDLYGDRENWSKRASNVLRVHKNRDLNLSFQAGIFLEGMRRYYELSRDEEAFQYIKKSCDRILAGGGKQGGNTCAAMSFLYRKTGERKYLDAALRQLPRRGEFGNPGKDFALSMRNAAICVGDLYHVAQQRRQQSVEKNYPESAGQPPAVSGQHPNK